MDYLTRQEIVNWAHAQPDDGIYCEWCLTMLRQTDEGLWFCPNEMCLNEEQGIINTDEE